MDKIFENKNTNLSIKPRKSDIRVKIRLVLVYLAFYDSLFDECYRCPEDKILKWQCNDATKVRALLLFIEKKKRKRERKFNLKSFILLGFLIVAVLCIHLSQEKLDGGGL